MYDKFDKDIVLEPSVEKLLQQRYYKTGENWFSLVKRIVDNVCQNETDEYKESVFELIFNRVFLPNSPCLVNAGTRNQGLLACFTVTPTEDDLGAHIDSLKDIALVAKHGGGCFSGDSVVYTQNGAKNISDVEADDFVLSYNEQNGAMSFERVIKTHTILHKSKEVHELYFKWGNLVASNNHPLFVFDGIGIKQKQVKDIKSGDIVIGSSDLIGVERNLPSEYFWLLGYTAGDGAVGKQNKQKSYRVRYTDAYLSNIKRVSEFAKSNIKKCDDKNAFDTAIFGKLAEKIYHEFIPEVRTSTKHAPASVFGALPHERFSFIVGCLDSDGTYNEQKQRFEFCTTSDNLANDFIIISGGLGIKLKHRIKKTKRQNESAIHIISFEKSEVLVNLINKYSSKYSVSFSGWTSGVINAPFVWAEKAVELGGQITIDKNKHYFLNIGNDTINISTYKKKGLITRDKLAKIMRFCGQNELSYAVLSSSVVKKNVVLDNELNMYDLTVKNNHTYLISPPNGINFVVVHNCGFAGTFFRPKNSPVAGSAHGYSYGPNAWAIRVSEYMDMITQSGFRKMALMYNLRSDHPDLDEYIELKQNKSEQFAYNFNQSVMATDEWMKHAQIDGTKENKQFLRLCKNAWNNGEPGLMFYDTINNNTPYKMFGETVEQSNPCALEGTLVDTPNGQIPVENIKVGDTITTLVGSEIVKEIDVLPERMTYEVLFSDGGAQYVTIGHAYHIIRDGEIRNDIRLGDVRIGEKVLVLRDDKKDCVEIISIKSYKAGTVYDLYCESDTWITSGYVQRGCSEQLLPSHLACVLASINISHEYFFDNGIFQFDKLEYVSTVATRFLDNIGDVNSFPSEKFKQRYEGFRPIGLGIMGYADALLKQKMRYGNSNALQFLEQTIKHMYRSARDESVRLGVVKGIPSKIGRLGRRNVTLISIAPTGSIGFISNCSHSIEPIFSPSFMRTDERGETYFFEHPLAKEDYFSSAINIDKSKIVTPDEHLDTQIVAQKHCDSGISKTVNLPNDATVNDIKEIFIKAWQNGCKGITVYRDGSRQFQVLESKEEDSLITQCKDGICEL